MVFTFKRQWKKEHPYHKVSNGSYEYFNGMSMPDLLKEIVKVDDYTVKFVLNRPEAPMIADLAMDFASIQSAEYADEMMTAGTPEKFRPVAGRYRAVPIRRLQEGRPDPLQGQSGLLERQGTRSTIWSSPLLPMPPCATRSSKPASVR